MDNYYLVGLYVNGNMTGKWALYNKRKATMKTGEFGEYGKTGETRLSALIEHAENIAQWTKLKPNQSEGTFNEDGKKIGIWTLYEDGHWMSGEIADDKRIGLW